VKDIDWMRRVKRVVSTFFLLNKKEDLDRDLDLDSQIADREETLSLIWGAHRDWIQAYRLFNFTVDEDLIDYSIRNLGATESRYQYLLKKARLNKVIAFDPEQLREVDAYDSVS